MYRIHHHKAPQHLATGHDAPVLFVSWSPDDKLLLTVSEVTVRLWDPATGQLVRAYT